jgi:hypothetical protein
MTWKNKGIYVSYEQETWLGKKVRCNKDYVWISRIATRFGFVKAWTKSWVETLYIKQDSNNKEYSSLGDQVALRMSTAA